MNIFNKPFEIIANSMMKNLRVLGLSSQEKTIIDQSLKHKYVPVMRNAFFMTIIAMPGVVLNRSADVLTVLSIISAITGIAWFALSLKEVKMKFIDFGVEVTSDMLQAFLTTMGIIGLTTVFSLLESFLPHFEATYHARVISSVITLIVLIKIMYDLLKSIIKFDANDAMLTGSSDASRRYYERSISGLRHTANILNSEHSLEVANFQIVNALVKYMEFLSEVGVEIDDGLSEEVDNLSANVQVEQKVFDEMAIPVLLNILMRYEPFARDSKRYEFVVKALRENQENYNKKNVPPQALVDSVFALAFETIADLTEEYKDELVMHDEGGDL